jgi:hypothetical protein
MPNDHIDREMEEKALLGLDIIAPQRKIVNVKSEAETKGHTYGSKIERYKKATAKKYEYIARRAKEIWRQHGRRSGEDQRNWRDVLSGIMDVIIQLPDIEKTRSKVKRMSPADRSKLNQSEKVLTHEQIAERALQIWQQNGCRPGEDQRNWAEAEKQLKAELNID